jgi:hypothetical protein
MILSEFFDIGSPAGRSELQHMIPAVVKALEKAIGTQPAQNLVNTGGPGKLAITIKNAGFMMPKGVNVTLLQIAGDLWLYLTGTAAQGMCGLTPEIGTTLATPTSTASNPAPATPTHHHPGQQVIQVNLNDGDPTRMKTPELLDAMIADPTDNDILAAAKRKWGHGRTLAVDANNKIQKGATLELIGQIAQDGPWDGEFYGEHFAVRIADLQQPRTVLINPFDVNGPGLKGGMLHGQNLSKLPEDEMLFLIWMGITRPEDIQPYSTYTTLGKLVKMVNNNDWDDEWKQLRALYQRAKTNKTAPKSIEWTGRGGGDRSGFNQPVGSAGNTQPDTIRPGTLRRSDVEYSDLHNSQAASFNVQDPALKLLQQAVASTEFTKKLELAEEIYALRPTGYAYKDLNLYIGNLKRVQDQRRKGVAELSDESRAFALFAENLEDMLRIAQRG